MELKLFVIATFVISAFAGWLAIPNIILISKKKKLFDELSSRKSHKGNVPRLGGVAFFPSFLFSVSLMLGLRYYYGYEISAVPLQIDAFKEFFFLISGGTLLFFVGMTDDLTGLSYKMKFAAQIVVAVLLIFCGVGIENLGGLFGLYHIPVIWGNLLTLMVVVLLVNAYNLIDGIDGLCSGLTLLALGTLGGWFCWSHLYVYGMIAMGMAGVVSVFFFYNVLGRRMKIFMGDTGSLMLGFLIAYLGLKFYNLNINTDMFNIQSAPAVLLGIVFIPAFDTCRVFCVRIAKGLSPFYPDRRHIHHKMLELGLSHFQGTMVIILLQAGFIALNVLLKNLNINVLFALNIVLGVVLIGCIDLLAHRLGRKEAKA
ncbi:glycosyltransferase family 4 protein [uncultured Alistipes sp.]|uniref:glycosyltransferase family 4 protein n=1 Tax=uncultured Alistipes sp. TaxID=538949 RepID=UPI0026063470|nr:MraY family glycosyltransferase [uncultured Alistipes sp.]